MHNRFGFHVVQEEEARRDLSRNDESELPGNRRRIPSPEQAVLQASVGHVFVHEAAVLRACTQKEDNVWVPDATQKPNLPAGKLQRN